MKTTVTKKITALLATVLLFTNLSAQQTATEKEQKQTALQEEEGKALKQWFDSGDIIIDATSEVAKYVRFTNAKGELNDYLCQKIKINRVLKGKVKAGYINLSTYAGGNQLINPDNTVEPQSGSGPLIGNRYLIKIKKSDLITEGYTAENNGVYVVDGDCKFITTVTYTSASNEKKLYQMLQDYCGVKTDGLEKKSPSPITLKKAEGKSYAEVMQIKKDRMLSNNSVNSLKCTQLYISEYISGQGNNKSIEVYNPTSSPINLSNYSLLIYHGGSTNATTIALTGTISALGTHVVSKPNASAAILAHTNQTNNNLNFNGDECIVLEKATIDIDKIGIIGTAIGSGGWTLTPAGSTVNTDLRRKYAIGIGDTSWSNCKGEWNVLSKDSVNDLGKHINICAAPDPQLNLSIANGTDSSGYFVFDVMGFSTGNPGTWFDGGTVNILYNTSAFNSNIYSTSGGVYVSQNSTFPSTIYQISAGDVGYDTLGINISTNTSLSSPSRTFLTSTPVKLYHVRLKVAQCGVNAVLSLTNFAGILFASNYTNTQTDNWINGVQYDTTYWTGSFNTPTTCALQITGFTPASVIAGAWYFGTTNTESQLTINGNGFGTTSTKPTVIMKNAVNNSNPQYIALDSFDIQSWNDNQIVLNVPSTLLSTNPNNSIGAYPGTGLIKVVPAGTTDTAVSSSAVTIPYILQNLSTNVPSKRRISFAYRNMTDSIGRADSSAYNFRFDIATVSNNTDPNGLNCRPLIKQAIWDWACLLGIRYRIGKDTTITTLSADGISYIKFKTGTVGVDTFGKKSFLAQTGLKTKQCITTLNYFSNEADIDFRKTPQTDINPSTGSPFGAWYYVAPNTQTLGSSTGNTPSSNPDFYTIALHELGHASLLLHVNDNADLMYYTTFASSPRPFISLNDFDGGSDNVAYSQGLSFSACPSTGAITIPPAGSGACENPTVSIEKIGDNTFGLTVYPNPASQVLNVSFAKQKESSNTVKLINIIGQPVFYKNIGKNEGANEVINISELAKGVYMLIVTDNANTVYKKIIIE
jgi:hypothetical protein